MTLVRFTRSASWHFTQGIEQLPLVALFVRDTAALNVPPGAMVPPPLEGELPDYSRHLDADTRAAAGVAWLDWWKAVIEEGVPRRQEKAEHVDRFAWLQERAVEHQALFDRPCFASFTDQPSLHEVLQLTSEEALQWAGNRCRALRSPFGGNQFSDNAIRKTAKQVSREHRVSPELVRACATVLPVAGHWWHTFSPGAVLCSVRAVNDPATARSILVEGFVSGLP